MEQTKALRVRWPGFLVELGFSMAWALRQEGKPALGRDFQCFPEVFAFLRQGSFLGLL